MLILVTVPAIVMLLLGSAANYNINNTKMPLRVRRDVAFTEPEINAKEIYIEVIKKAESEELIKTIIDKIRTSKKRIDNEAHNKEANSYLLKKLFHDKRNVEKKRGFWANVSNVFHAITGTEQKIHVVIPDTSLQPKYEKYTDTNHMNNNNFVYYTTPESAQYPNNPGQVENGGYQVKNLESSTKNPGLEDVGTTEAVIDIACVLYCGGMRCPTGYRKIGNRCIINRG